MNSSRGFTLVEILVVIVIIGLMAGMAVLAIGTDPQRKIKQEAERARTVLQLAADEALMLGREYGLVIQQSGYQVVQFDEQKLQWQETVSPAFDHYTLPDTVEISLQSEGSKVDLKQLNQADDEKSEENSDTLKPALLLLSSGEVTPFTLHFSSDDQANGYRLSSDGLGEIKMDRQHD